MASFRAKTSAFYAEEPQVRSLDVSSLEYMQVLTDHHLLNRGVLPGFLWLCGL